MNRIFEASSLSPAVDDRAPSRSEGARSCGVLVLGSGAPAAADELLASIERRRGWSAPCVAIIVWQVDGVSGTAREGVDRLAAAEFPRLVDRMRLEGGRRYHVAADERVWFEGTLVRVAARASTDVRPIDRLLLSLAEGWGSDSAAMLLGELPGNDGECGLRIIRAVGGITDARPGESVPRPADGEPAPASTASPVSPMRVVVPAAEASSDIAPAPVGRPPTPGRERRARVFSIPARRLELARSACAAVVSRARESRIVRVWVPGCGAGGLTYAIAMLLDEATASWPSRPRLVVYGTDVDSDAIATARAGRYPAGSALGMDPAFRGRYTFDEGETIRVAEALRHVCIFTQHELGADVPLARMDLVVAHDGLFDGIAEAERQARLEALHFSVGQAGVLLALDSLDDFPEDRFERREGGWLSARKVSRETAAGAPTVPAKPAASARAIFEPAVPGAPAWLGARRLETWVQTLGVAWVCCDEQLRVIAASAEAQAAFGLSPAERDVELGALARQLRGGQDLATVALQALALARDAGRRGPPVVQELTLRSGQDIYRVRLAAAVDDEVGPSVSITFSELTALELAKSQALAHRRQQAAIARVSEHALGLADPSSLYEEALAALFGNIHECVAGIIVEGGAGPGHLDVVASRGLGADPLGNLRRLDDGAALLDAVIARGCIVSQGGDRAVWAEGSAPNRTPPRRRSHHRPSSVACGVGFPIVAGGEVLGAIAIYGRRAGIDEPEHQPFLRAVANVLGGAIVQSRARRRVELELEVSQALAAAPTLEGAGEGLRLALTRALAVDAVEIWTAYEGGPGRWLRRWPSVTERGAEPRVMPPDPLGGGAAFACKQDGQSLLCVPIAPRGEPSALLVLRGGRSVRPDRELSQGLVSVGRMLSLFLERVSTLERVLQREAEYRQKGAELEALYACLPVGISIHDNQGTVRHVNRHLGELEQADAALPSRPLERLYAEEVPPWVERARESGEPIHDIELSVADGEDIWWWLCNFAPIRALSGGLLGVSVVVQNVTPQKRAEARLREADREKDDFLAVLGHELRNPIAAIRNATDLMSRLEHLSPQLRRLQNIFDRQTLQATKLIEALLDVSRVARGKVELSLRPVQVVELVRQVLEDRQQQFQERRLTAQLSPSDLWVLADRPRLQQVVDNLLSNALRFTPQGGHIQVEVSAVGWPGSERRGCIRVEDDGVGIDPELLPHIFEPFRQGLGERAGQAGLGLGLALVKGLLELHGFELRAMSAGRGKGASFEVGFPLAAAPDEAPPPSRVDTRPLDLLLIEDDDDVAAALSELLMHAGHRVERRATAEDGLAALHARRPDVVLCDIGLPGMSGLSLASAVRSEPALEGLRLVALTGYSDSASQSRIDAAGFDRQLLKPVQLETLQHCLSRLAPHLS